jgi:uncharacterized coiled-coil DUF342 family protein
MPTPAEDHEEVAQRGLRDDLRNAERKLQELVAKRDALNTESRLIRDERDMLNNQRSGLMEEMRTVKWDRDKIITEMRTHQRHRNNFQKRAKTLIAKKKAMRGGVMDNLEDDIDTLQSDLTNMEVRYETTSQTFEKEKTLVTSIGKKHKKLEDLMEKEPDQKALSGELNTIDERIDALFKEADKEHLEVVRLSEGADEQNKKVRELGNNISHLVNQANKKHEEMKKVRDRANDFHEKAMEMRNKVGTIRTEQRDQRNEARKVLQDINRSARKALGDEKKLKEVEESALDKLRKGGKITL